MSELVGVHDKEDASHLNRYSLHTDAHVPNQFLGIHRKDLCLSSFTSQWNLLINSWHLGLSAFRTAYFRLLV